MGFLGPFYSFRHPRTASFLWASLAHLILTFPWAFAKSFGLPRPNYHILYFWGLLAFAPIPFTNFSLWAPLTHLCLLSTSYDFHGLATSFSGLPWAHLLSLEPFFLFHRFVDHYSYHSGLMVLSYFTNSSSFTSFILLGFFLLLGLLAKASINTQPLPLPRVCLLRHSSFQDKTYLFLFFPLTFPALPQWIRIGGSLSLLTHMACIQWPQLFACLFWVKCHPSKAFSPKRSFNKNPKIDPFFPHHQTTLSESLDREPISPVLARYK